MIYKMIVITLIEFKSPGIQEELSMLKLINFFLMLSSSVSSVSRNTKNLCTKYCEKELWSLIGFLLKIKQKFSNLLSMLTIGDKEHC